MAKAATVAKTATPKAQVSKLPSVRVVDFNGQGSVDEAVKAAEASFKKVYQVPMDKIMVAQGYNVRAVDSEEYKEDLIELKESILAEGFYSTKPLAGYVGRNAEGESVIYVTDGHRRLEAAKMARAEGWDAGGKLPVILKAPATDAVALTISLLRENAGRRLSMMETALLLKRLIAPPVSMSTADAALKMGLSDRYLKQLILLLEAPKPVQAYIKSGKLAGTKAAELLGGKGTAAEKIEKIAKFVEKQEKERAPAAPGEKRDPAAPRMQTTTTKIAYERGVSTEYANIEPFIGLFSDSNWFSLNEEEGMVDITEDIEIDVRIRRPKVAVVKVEPEPEELDTSAIAPNGSRKRGRPRKEVNIEQDDLLSDVPTEEETGFEPGELAALGIEPDPADGL